MDVMGVIEFFRTGAAGACEYECSANLVEEIAAEEDAAGVMATAMCPLPLVGFRKLQWIFFWLE